MFPTISAFGYNISWYWLVIAITIVVSILFFKWYFAKNYTTFNNSPRISAKLFVLWVTSCFILSKLFYTIEYFLIHTIDSNQLYSLISNYQGMRAYGIVLGYTIIVVVFYRMLLKKNLMPYIDTLGITGCLAISIGKFACLLEGHGCYGIYTNLPWGMHFIYDSNPSLLPVHPTPLYDSILHVLLFVSLLKINFEQRKEGSIFLFFVIGSSLCNIIVETVRNNERIFSCFSMAQIAYAICLSLSFILFKKIYYPKKNKSIIKKSIP